MKDNELFQDLFVLELANNHWGNVERGLKIIETYSRVVRFNNIKAAIKLQFRNVDTFIHKDFLQYKELRYINKTLQTKLSKEEYRTLVNMVKKSGCLTMATPFDETSVEWCREFDLDLIKIASSDINDWILIEAIAKLKKPVIASVGGSSLKDIDDLVSFFKKRHIPLAINHCVSLYPVPKNQLELNQINFLKDRFPENVIGLSTHETNEFLDETIMLAYAKGARTFERHVDIEEGDYEVSPYCSLPEDIDRVFKSYHRAVQLCGGAGSVYRVIPEPEIAYLDTLVRGVYAKSDLKAGHVLSDDDVYLAIPLQKGQISCRELMRGEVLVNDVSKDQKIMIQDIDSPYSHSEKMRNFIMQRGVEVKDD